MGLLKSIALTGGLVLTTSFSVLAADLSAPPPPLPAAPVPLRGSIDQSGIYLRGDIGAGFMGNTKARYNDPLGTLATATVTYQQGDFNHVPFGGLGVGYQFNNWFRADVTGELRGSSKFGFKDSYVNTAPPGTIGTNTLTGKLQTSLVMANVYADLGNFNGWTPFVGAGAGMAFHKVSRIEDYGTASPGGLGPFPSAGFYSGKSKSNFAWAVMAGVSYDVSPNVKLEAGYRYLNMGKVTSGAACTTTCPAGVTIGLGRVDSHDFKFGVRWLLSSADPMPMAPVGYPVVSRRY